MFEEAYKTITIGDLAGDGLPVHKRFGKQKRYYIRVTIDDAVRETSNSERATAPRWTESFHFAAASESSVLKISLYQKSILGADALVGTLEANVFALLKSGFNQTILLPLQLALSSGEQSRTTATMTFRISSQATHSAIVDSQNAVAQAAASRPLDTVNCTISVAQPMIAATRTVKPAGDLLVPVMDRMKIFVDLVDKVAEIHPYANAAWKILSSVYQIAKNQQSTDAKVVELVDSLTDILEFVTDSKATSRIHAQKQILLQICKQSVECAYSIQAYFNRNHSFMKRAVKSTLFNVDDRIQAYCNTLARLKTEFLSQATLHTELTIIRLMDTLESMPAEIDLNDMRYAGGARYDPKKLCLPNTRTQIINEIIEWVNDDSEEQPTILLLQGGAGTGKSTIAHTIAAHFDGIGRLGSSFCFDKSRQTELNPTNLFSTIARDLADRDPPRKKALWEVIKDNRSLRFTRSPNEQFDNFIIKPSEMVTAIGPNLVIVDALDESADTAGRSCLVDIFSQGVLGLPSGLKFLVTSRAEFDVAGLATYPTVRVLSMEKIDDSLTTDDIKLFVCHNLDSFPEEECHRLAERAEGLFQWAFTACNYISGPRTLLEVSKKRLKDMLTLKSKDLDILYTEILVRAIENVPEFKENYSLVLTRMLSLFRPLPVHSLQRLRLDIEPEYATAAVINELGSLLHGVYDEDASVRPIHTSFRDYLLDPSRSGRFCIKIPDRTNELASRCLDIMNVELMFNIARIPSSYLPNSQLEQQIVNTVISPVLIYACEYVALHITETPTEGLINKISIFLKNHFLHWLEVLSLKGKLGATKNLFHLLQSEHHDTELSHLAKDGQRFVATFFQPIAMSASHIYLSATSFTPSKSPIRSLFCPSFCNAPTIDVGTIGNWPSLTAIFEGHLRVVTSVAFSPNGRQLASASADETVRLWNVESGEPIGKPLEGHSDVVTFITFSPDGRRLASASRDKMVVLWDVESGEPIGEPLEGHLDIVSSISFSPDGRRLASASFDKTVRFWDVESGEPIGKPLEGHSDVVASVTFSPDGKRLASASWDRTMCLWDVDSGKYIGEPLEGHSNKIASVTFSPDGRRLASASWDHTVRFWDVESGEPIGKPLEGHWEAVISVIFSPNGRRLATAAWDRTIWLWDAESGERIGGLLDGHSGDVTSISFSPDGKWLASASEDRKVLLWDVESSELMGQPSEVPFEMLGTVSFSPDGRRLATAFWDRAICLWDAESDELIGDPLIGHSREVTSVSFSPDGVRLASASCDTTVRLWNIELGEPIDEALEGHRHWVTSVTFSPDGKLLASASEDQTVIMWNVESGEMIGEPLEGHSDAVTSVAFSPDGRRLASASDDKTVRLWDVESREPLGEPMTGHLDSVRSVSFSPDGGRLVSASKDRTVRLWDVESREPLGEPLEGHSSVVESVTFSPDGKRLASGSWNDTVCVWDVETGELTGRPLEGHFDIVASVAFSPDGKRLASASCDGTVRLWDVDPDVLLDKALDGDVRLVGYPGSGGSAIITQPDTKPRAMQIPEENFPLGCQLKNGWLLGPNDELILWIPPWYRENLWWSDRRQRLVIGKQTKLSWANFKHGPNWADGVM